MEKEEAKLEKGKEVKSLYTSRLIFSSVLDTIYKILIAIQIAGTVIALLINGISFRIFLVTAIYTILLLYIYNWLYRCYIKSMICITKNSVYVEMYYPFIYKEVSVPIERITRVTAIKFLHIFRFIVISQYHKIPLILPIWDNFEFKNELDKLLIHEDGKCVNEFKDKQLLPDVMIKNRKVILLVVFGLIGLLLIVGSHPIRYHGNKYVGVYTNDDYESIYLYDDGTCNITDVYSDSENCTWEEDLNEIEVKYQEENYYGNLKDNGVTFYYSDDTLTNLFDTFVKE